VNSLSILSALPPTTIPVPREERGEEKKDLIRIWLWAPTLACNGICCLIRGVERRERRKKKKRDRESGSSSCSLWLYVRRTGEPVLGRSRKGREGKGRKKFSQFDPTAVAVDHAGR